MGNDEYPLCDLDTQSNTVRNMYNTWIEYMVSTYSSRHSPSGTLCFSTDHMIVDGLRVDSTKNVEQAFWPGFNSAAGVYCLGEIAEGDVPYVCPYQNYIDGVLGYPSYVLLRIP